MPLTKAGRRTLRKLVLEHGAEKGKRIFYAMENSPGKEEWKKAVIAKKPKSRGK
jgi:hypothetical protein